MKSTKLMTRAVLNRIFELREKDNLGWEDVATKLAADGYKSVLTGVPYKSPTLASMYSAEKARRKKQRQAARSNKTTLVTVNTPTGPITHQTPESYWAWQMQRCLDEAMMWRQKMTEKSTNRVTK